MAGEHDESVQLTFRDGELVEAPDGARPVSTEPVEPGAETGFPVAAKDGAIAVNDALAAAVETHGRTLAFGSRAAAEAYADQLSAEGGDLRVQAAAPNDPADADAYLLAAHDPSVREPVAVDGDTWTFDVGANLYGALGEAILLDAPRPHALHYFVRWDLGLDAERVERLRVDVRPGTPVAVDGPDGGERARWVPDCIVVARDGHGGPELARYHCEVKTGDASFERSQVAAMERLAREARVLKIRVLVDELPDRYSLRIREVEPPG